MISDWDTHHLVNAPYFTWFCATFLNRYTSVILSWAVCVASGTAFPGIVDTFLCNITPFGSSSTTVRVVLNALTVVS